MNKRKNILLLFGITIILALACNLPGSPPDSNTATDATMTALVLTQTAIQSQPSLEGPSFTPEINSSPTITPTLSPSAPTVTVSVDTNCRKGPGKAYDYLTNLPVGVEAEVVGKYTSANPVYWIIKRDSVICWLWGKYATVEGDTSNLQEMVPPPTQVPPSSTPPSSTPSLTPSPTPTPSPTATGVLLVTYDLIIDDVYLNSNNEVVLRITHSGMLAGAINIFNNLYMQGGGIEGLYCLVPLTGAVDCNTFHTYQASETITIKIDSPNEYIEIDEANNSITVKCNISPGPCFIP